METRIREIDGEIERLQEELKLVKGQTTEVYSRIVGYYRSVKNWNHGKKSEYQDRIPFSAIAGDEPIQVELAKAPQAAPAETEAPVAAAPAAVEVEESRLEEITPVTDKEIVSSENIVNYSYFYRSSCPNCPAMKEVLELLDLEGDHLNVDMERGLEEASNNMVFSAPTVIFRDEKGEELFRTCHPTDVESLFAIGSESA